MKRLIVNADDFGMAESVNHGIIKGHVDGIITSASLLSGAEAAEHAVSLAREHPNLGIGIHLCLTLETPVLPPEKLPGLAKGGRFPGSPLQVAVGLASRRIKKYEVELELRAQIERALELGVELTHADGHQHVHMMPGILPIIARLAVEYHIPAIRYPVGPKQGGFGMFSAAEKKALETMSKFHRREVATMVLKHPDHFFGLSNTGKLDVKGLLEILTHLPEGTSELMCHPGLKNDRLAKELKWGYGWEKELAALLDGRVWAALMTEGVELVNYSRLGR